MLREEPWLDSELRADARMAYQTAALANLLGASRKDKMPWTMDDFMPKWGKEPVREPATPQDLLGMAQMLVQAGMGKIH